MTGKFGANDRITRGREIESWLIALEREAAALGSSRSSTDSEQVTEYIRNEDNKRNFPFLLCSTWVVLMHLAKHLTRCGDVLCFRPFHQLNLLISFLTSVLNLTFIFFSMLSLRQNSFLWSPLQLSYPNCRSLQEFASVHGKFCIPAKHRMYLTILHFLTSNVTEKEN